MNAEQEPQVSTSHRGALPCFMYSPVSSDADEISLIGIWRILTGQWKLIVGLMCLSVLCAATYLFMTPPVYEVTAVLLSPETKNVQLLNIPGISQVTEADMFADLKGTLKSRALFKQFIDKNQRLSSLGDDYLPNIMDTKDKFKKEGGLAVSVSLQSPDFRLVAEALNAFILFAEKKVIEDFLAGIEVKVANQKKDIASQIKIGRDFAVQRRLDRIAMLEEQIGIASFAKITERETSGYALSEGKSLGFEFSSGDEPLYRRGVKELTLEKEFLEKRKNDEPFIDGLRDKQERLAQLDAGLQQFREAMAIVHAVQIDQQAMPPKTPVKPRLMLVLTLSLVIGAIIGVFGAFAANFVKDAKVQTKEGMSESLAAITSQRDAKVDKAGGLNV